MAGSVNKVILVGNLGEDPEIRRTQDGRPIANLSVATSESWRDKATGERKEKTEWHRVVIFNEGLCKIAEQYLKKGAKVYIEGQLQTRKWTDQDGVEKYSTEVVLQNFNSTLTMLDGRAAAAAAISDPMMPAAISAPAVRRSAAPRRAVGGRRPQQRHGRRYPVLSSRQGIVANQRSGQRGYRVATLSAVDLPLLPAGCSERDIVVHVAALRAPAATARRGAALDGPAEPKSPPDHRIRNCRRRRRRGRRAWSASS